MNFQPEDIIDEPITPVKRKLTKTEREKRQFQSVEAEQVAEASPSSAEEHMNDQDFHKESVLATKLISRRLALAKLPMKLSVSEEIRFDMIRNAEETFTELQEESIQESHELLSQMKLASEAGIPIEISDLTRLGFPRPTSLSIWWPLTNQALTTNFFSFSFIAMSSLPRNWKRI